MSDTTVTTQTVNTTASSPEVSQPLNSTKPYDMLDAYVDETPKEDGEAPEKATESTGQDSSADAPKVEDPTKENTDPKATKDDKVIDGVEELPIKRMVNGKEVEFKIKDAIASHLKIEEFNRGMDRRVGEVSKRERAWQDGQDTFKEKIGKVIEVAQNGDFVSGIRALAKLAAGSSNLDVTKFEQMYFNQLEEVGNVYTKMNPEQRDAYWAKRSAAEAKAETERLRGEKANTIAQSQLQEKVASLQEEHKMPNEEFWGNYKFLVDSEVGTGKKFTSPEDITAEDVLGYSLEVRHWEKVYSAGEAVGISDEAILDEVGKITKAHPGITVDEIKTVIKNAGLASPSAVENLNRKVGKNGQPNSAASSTKKQNANGLDKEDLDFLYRNQPKAYSRIIR